MGGRFTSGERRGLIALLIVVVLVWVMVLGTRQCDHSTPTTPLPQSAGHHVRVDTVNRATEHTTATRRTKRAATKDVKRSKASSAAGRQRSFLDEEVPSKP